MKKIIGMMVGITMGVLLSLPVFAETVNPLSGFIGEAHYVGPRCSSDDIPRHCPEARNLMQACLSQKKLCEAASAGAKCNAQVNICFSDASKLCSCPAAVRPTATPPAHNAMPPPSTVAVNNSADVVPAPERSTFAPTSSSPAPTVGGIVTNQNPGVKGTYTTFPSWTAPEVKCKDGTVIPRDQLKDWLHALGDSDALSAYNNDRDHDGVPDYKVSGTMGTGFKTLNAQCDVCAPGYSDCKGPEDDGKDVKHSCYNPSQKNDICPNG